MCFYICCFYGGHDDEAYDDMNQSTRVLQEKNIKIGNIDYVSDFFPELYDVKASTKRYYLITKYAGDDLFKYLTEKDLIKEDNIKHIFRQIVVATGMMHCMGIAHGDMSLENVCIEENKKTSYTVKLIDFELSLIHPHSPYIDLFIEYNKTGVGDKIENQSERAIIHFEEDKNMYQNELITSLKTNPGNVRAYGKLRTVSPERYQAHLSTKKYYCSYKDDIYGLGIILYVLLFKTYPYRAPTETDSQFNSIVSSEWIKTHSKTYNDTHNENHNTMSHDQSFPIEISDDAIDLIDKILKPENTRIGIEGILKHRWFND